MHLDNDLSVPVNETSSSTIRCLTRASWLRLCDRGVGVNKQVGCMTTATVHERNPAVVEVVGDNAGVALLDGGYRNG